VPHSIDPEITMNRLIVRLVAGALAAGFTIAELVGVSLLVENAPLQGELLMPRVVVTPAAPEGASGDGETRAEALTSKALPRT
jgi:hypothetical protein